MLDSCAAVNFLAPVEHIFHRGELRPNDSEETVKEPFPIKVYADKF